MKTSVDTNILSAIWGGEHSAYALAHLLIKLQSDGPIVISAPVWVELAARPGLEPGTLESMLSEARIEVDFDLPRPVWDLASRAYSAYTRKRRESGASPPRRILADFLIGAHAAVKTNRLLSADARFFHGLFPGLQVIEPPLSRTNPRITPAETRW